MDGSGEELRSVGEKEEQETRRLIRLNRSNPSLGSVDLGKKKSDLEGLGKRRGVFQESGKQGAHTSRIRRLDVAHASDASNRVPEATS